MEKYNKVRKTMYKTQLKRWSHFINIKSPYTLVKSIYYMEVERDNKVKFRGKVYCTDRSDKKIKQSLNNNKYTEYSAAPTGQKYITV